MKASRQVTILEVIHNPGDRNAGGTGGRTAGSMDFRLRRLRFPAILKSFVW